MKDGYIKKDKKYDVKRYGGKALQKGKNEKGKVIEADIELDSILKNFDEVSSVPMKCGEAEKEFLEPLVSLSGLKEKITALKWKNSIALFDEHDRNSIKRAREIIEEIGKEIKKKPAFQRKGDFEGYTASMERITDLSNEYYELIPRVEFAYDKINILDNEW